MTLARPKRNAADAADAGAGRQHVQKKTRIMLVMWHWSASVRKERTLMLMMLVLVP